MRLKFVKMAGFEVRYWFPGELLSAFRQELGPTEVECFFSLNPQISGILFLLWKYRAVVHASETLRKTTRILPPVMYCADSLYLRTTKDLWKPAPS